MMKKYYNSILEREKRAQVFFQRASSEEIDKWMPAYTEIIKQLSLLMGLIPNMTNEEILNGFKDE